MLSSAEFLDKIWDSVLALKEEIRAARLTLRVISRDFSRKLYKLSSLTKRLRRLLNRFRPQQLSLKFKRAMQAPKWIRKALNLLSHSHWKKSLSKIKKKTPKVRQPASIPIPLTRMMKAVTGTLQTGYGSAAHSMMKTSLLPACAVHALTIACPTHRLTLLEKIVGHKAPLIGEHRFCLDLNIKNRVLPPKWTNSGTWSLEFQR